MEEPESNLQFLRMIPANGQQKEEVSVPQPQPVNYTNNLNELEVNSSLDLQIRHQSSGHLDFGLKWLRKEKLVKLTPNVWLCNTT